MDKQTITGDGGASYTLTHAVANAQEIEVFVNNVRQEAGVAYTVAGTALSMTGNVASTDDFYVIYQGKALQTVVPPDGSVSTGKLASGAVTSAKLDTNIAISGTLDVTGQITESGKEYFHVDLTTAQSGLSDNVKATVDFGGSGTVKYDTKSNFDSANDAYLLDSSDGVYLISYSIGLRCEDLGAESIVDAAAYIRISEDGTNFSVTHGSGAHVQDSVSDEIGSLTLSGTFIYKATTATTKIQLQGYVNTSGTNIVDWIITEHAGSLTGTAPSGSTNARCTFLSIVRIA